MRLTKGMYGSEMRPSNNTLFGLRAGQMKFGPTKLGHNVGWYNQKGEKLGFGDLDLEDLKRIMTELEDGELFIILGESDSFWHFVKHNGPIGAMAKTSRSEMEPGMEYVADKACYVVMRGQIHAVNRGKAFTWQGQNFLDMKSKELLELMKGCQ